MNRNNDRTETQQEHLPLAVLRRYQEGSLPPTDEHRVERHVLSCALCGDLLTAMDLQTAPETTAAAREIKGRVAAAIADRKTKVIPLFGWRQMGVAAAVLLLVLSAGVVVWFNLQPGGSGVNTPVAGKTKAKSAGDEKTEAPEIAVFKPASPAGGDAVADAAAREQSESAADFFHQTNPPVVAGQAEAPPAAGKEEEIIAVTPLPTVVGRTGQLSDSLAAGQTAAPATAPAMALQQNLEGRVAGVSVEKEVKSKAAVRIRGMASANETRSGKSVSGQVVDEDGVGIPGVTVLVKGTKNGIATDADGNFTINLPNDLEDVILTYSFIGYVTTEKKIRSQAMASADVTMKADAKSLSEVVVTGDGTQSKSEMTGAVSAARPAGGKRAFRKYLETNLQYPAAAREQKLEGRVVVRFTVEPNGRLSDLRVLRSLSPECDAEALRLVQQGPAWQPGKQGSNTVPQQVRVTVKFGL